MGDDVRQQLRPEDVPDELIRIAGEAWRTAPQKRDGKPTRMRYALAAAWSEIERQVREQVAAGIRADKARGMAIAPYTRCIAIALGEDPDEAVDRMARGEGDDLTALRGRAIDAVAALSPITKHGQLCPVWTGRASDVPMTKCNCWIRRDAERAVGVVLDVVQLELERLTSTAKVAGGLHRSAEHDVTELTRLLADASTHLRTACTVGRHDTWGDGYTCAACQLAERIDTALNTTNRPETKGRD